MQADRRWPTSADQFETISLLPTESIGNLVDMAVRQDLPMILAAGPELGPRCLVATGGDSPAEFTWSEYDIPVATPLLQELSLCGGATAWHALTKLHGDPRPYALRSTPLLQPDSPDDWVAIADLDLPEGPIQIVELGGRPAFVSLQPEIMSFIPWAPVLTQGQHWQAIPFRIADQSQVAGSFFPDATSVVLGTNALWIANHDDSQHLRVQRLDRVW
jgi:hypothetical protein